MPDQAQPDSHRVTAVTYGRRIPAVLTKFPGSDSAILKELRYALDSLARDTWAAAVNNPPAEGENIYLELRIGYEPAPAPGAHA